MWSENNKKNTEEKKDEQSLLTEYNLVCLTYKIDRFYYTKTLGTSYSKKTAIGIFLAVKLIIASNTKKTESTEDVIFKLTSNKNCEYETSIEGTSAMLMSGNNTFGVFAKHCHPKVPVEGYVIFEVPKESEYSIVIRYYTLSLTMKLLPNLELTQSNVEKQKEIKCEEINQKNKQKIGLLKFEKGTSKFNCGICKKTFFADRVKNDIVICPFCKSKNGLPSLKHLKNSPLPKFLRIGIVVAVLLWIFIIIIFLLNH